MLPLKITLGSDSVSEDIVNRLLLPVIVRAKELKAFGMVTNTNAVVVCSDEQELVECDCVSHRLSFSTSEVQVPTDFNCGLGIDSLGDVNLANEVVGTNERRSNIVVEVGVKVLDAILACARSSRIQNHAGEDACEIGSVGCKQPNEVLWRTIPSLELAVAHVRLGQLRALHAKN